MGIMTAWENFSRKQYDIWGSKLQSKYNFWDKYDNPELREKCRKIWEIMPAALQKKLYNLLIEILKNYGPEAAKKIVEALSLSFVSIIK